MKSWAISCIAVLATSCDRRFNINGLLKEEPSPAEIIGKYEIAAHSYTQDGLREMGYEAVASSCQIHEDHTFSATNVPGCCIHGWDERSHEFTGGLYELSGMWQIEKQDEVFVLKVDIQSIQETTGIQISDENLASERTPPNELSIKFLEERPLALGFGVFNGDFWYVPFLRVPAEVK